MDTLTKLANLNNLGIPQTVIAYYSHCHKTTIGKIIRGEHMPSQKTLSLIDEGIAALYVAINNAISKEDEPQ